MNPRWKTTSLLFVYEIVLINATWPLLLLVMPTKQLAWTAVPRTVAIGLLTAKCLLAQCGRLAGDGRALLHLKTEGGVPQGRDREGGNGLVRHLHLFAVSGRSLSGVFVRHALSADFHLSYLLLFWCRVSLLISLSRCYTIFFSSLRRFRVLRLDRPFPSPVRNRLLHLGKSGRSSVTAYCSHSLSLFLFDFALSLVHSAFCIFARRCDSPCARQKRNQFTVLFIPP